jgi:aldehyde dehydrogenase (NAD+)
MKVHPLYINGGWREGSEGAVSDDINPATGAVFARVAQAGPRDVEDALAAAHAARGPWQKWLVNEREALLLDTASLIAKRATEIRDLIIEETGSVMMKAPWPAFANRMATHSRRVPRDRSA